MLFIDSSYLIALLISTDKKHPRTNDLNQELTEKKIINNTVLSEVLNSLTKFGGKKGKLIFNLINETFEIEYLNKQDYQEAMDIYLKYDGSINYSDCTILKKMKKKNINKIVSFDSDFDKVNGIVRIH